LKEEYWIKIGIINAQARDLAIGRFPVQGVLRNCLKVFIVSEATASKWARGPIPWNVNAYKN